MEVTNALLVAMMFIVLITMGVGNIIMALAAIIDKRTTLKVDPIHTSWVVLLLLVHFNLFWHVLDILTIEEWNFLGFLYVVAGAVIIFFATHILLPDAANESTDVREHYFDSPHAVLWFARPADGMEYWSGFLVWRRFDLGGYREHHRVCLLRGPGNVLSTGGTPDRRGRGVAVLCSSSGRERRGDYRLSQDVNARQTQTTDLEL